MNWSRISAIVRKDVREITANRMVVIPMIVLPVVLCVALPLFTSILAMEYGHAAINGASFIEEIIPHYPVPAELTEVTEQIVYIFLNYTFLPFFMLVPLMSATLVAANAVVGEKERKTLETLLYSPTESRELLVAKALAVFLPAAATTVAAFLAFFVLTNAVGWATRGILLVRSPVWIPGMLLLMPAVVLLGLAVSIMVSLKAKSFMEAQQTAGMVVLPVIALVAGQMSGLVVLSLGMVVLVSILLLVVDVWLITRVAARFEREQVLKTI
jgi:ABC-2 type transport system permease protein